MFTVCGTTSSYATPIASANCMASEARLPPMSAEPMLRLSRPSALTAANAEDSMPTLNQKPVATPRPRFSPLSSER